MKKHAINKIFLLVLLGTVLCPLPTCLFPLCSIPYALSPAHAAQDLAPYPVPYWIIGNLAQGNCPIAPENFQIVVYKDPALPANGGDGTYRYLTNGAYADGYSGVSVQNSSPFKVNAYDDLKMQKFTGTFYVGVVAKADANGDTWGVNETSFAIGADQVGLGGYSLSPVLVLKKGEGVPSPVPTGTVPLTITHDGNNNIVISWDTSQTAYHNPNIYILMGDGSGQYSNDPANWQLATDPEVVNYFENPINLTDGNLQYLKQFGNDSTVKEAYFKALESGRVKGEVNPDTGRTYLEDAWAVGKMDISLPGNTFQLINVPFVLNPNNVQSVIGAQLSSAMLQYNLNGLRQIVLANGAWDMEISFDPATGYWLKSNDKAAVCTFYGDVIRDTYSKQLALGFDLYGQALPVQINSATLPILPVNGDKLLYLGSGGLLQVVYSNAWDNPNFALNAASGFWYQNSQAAPIRYLRVTP